MAEVLTALGTLGPVTVTIVALAFICWQLLLFLQATIKIVETNTTTMLANTGATQANTASTQINTEVTRSMSLLLNDIHKNIKDA